MPNEIRCIVTHFKNSKGHICCRLSWHEIEPGEIVGVKLHEEMFEASLEEAYVSRLAVDHSRMKEGTFKIDKNGKRHFQIEGETGDLRGEMGTMVGEKQPVMNG